MSVGSAPDARPRCPRSALLPVRWRAASRLPLAPGAPGAGGAGVHAGRAARFCFFSSRSWLFTVQAAIFWARLVGGSWCLGEGWGREGGAGAWHCPLQRSREHLPLPPRTPQPTPPAVSQGSPLAPLCPGPGPGPYGPPPGLPGPWGWVPAKTQGDLNCLGKNSQSPSASHCRREAEGGGPGPCGGPPRRRARERPAPAAGKWRVGEREEAGGG